MSEPLKWDEKMEKEFLDDCFVGLAFVDQRVRDTYLAARQRDADRIEELETAYAGISKMYAQGVERIAELEVRIIDLEDRLYHAAHDALELEAEVKKLRKANAVWAKTAKDGIPVYCVEPDPPTAPTEGA